LPQEQVVPLGSRHLPQRLSVAPCSLEVKGAAMKSLGDNETKALPSGGWQWLKWGVLCLLCLLFVGVGYQSFRSQRATDQLREAVHRLDREEPDWRIEEIEAARVIVHDFENAALASTAAADRLPTNWPDLVLAEAFEKLDPPMLLRDEQAVLLRSELDKQRPALEIARLLARMPNGRHPLVYKRPLIGILLPTQQKARTTTNLLKYDALLRAHEEDMKGAMTACRAAINAGRSIGDEPFGISQLIRIACVTMGCQSIERTLAQGEPASEDLAELQKLLENEDTHPTRLIILRGERCLIHDTFEFVERGEMPLSIVSSIAENPVGESEWSERLLGWHTRGNVRAEHPLALDLLNRFVATEALPLKEQLEAEQNLEAEVSRLPTNAVLTRTLMPSVLKLSVACRRKQAYVRCMIAALAVERYRRIHGDWPASLEQLVPELLRTVPVDPFDGEPLRFRRLADGVIIYSVGADGADDAGTLDRDNSLRAGADLGYRLWDVKQRRQAPAEKPKLVEPKVVD
jgi:hypothetical protein